MNNMQSYTYLLVNIVCISVPLISSFYPKHAFYKEWKPFFKANLLVALVFIVWDILFTKAGVWGFNTDYLTGIYVINLPIEEVLFFICIPYACVFSYFAFQYLINRNPLQNMEHIVSHVLIIALLVIAVFNYDRLYTSVTFFSTAALLTYLRLKKVNLAMHYLSYIFILPFFYLSNGILTGSFIVEPIVWYNDLENLGIRISNIPIEDSIYGMLLIFMNIQIYDLFKTKKAND